MQVRIPFLPFILSAYRARVFLVDTHIDLEREAKRHQVVKKALREAREERPATTAPGLDGPEQEIVQAYTKKNRLVTAYYAQQLKQEQDQQAQHAERWDPKRLEECYDTGRHELATLDMTSYKPLAVAWQRLCEKARDLRAFRQQRGIDRTAIYPEDYTWRLAVLVGMVMIEGIANMTFFARGLPGGLVEALFVALLVASFNVVMAFGVGFGLRWMNCPGWPRLLTVGGGAVYIGILGLFHLSVAHFRLALMGTNPEEAATEAIVSLTQNPLGLTDIYSWFLILIGVVSAIIALVEGYLFDDRIPGFGAITRRCKVAEADYSALQEQYLANIQMINQTQMAAVDTRCADAKTAMVAYRACVGEIKRLVRSYIEACRVLAEACVALQRRYRAANEAVRNTPAPAYFAEEPRCPFEPDESITRDLATVAEAEQVALDVRRESQLLHEQADSIKHRIRALCSRHLQAAPAYFVQVESGAQSPTVKYSDGAKALVAPDKETQEEMSDGK
jgi:hypothetical protein